jgi:biotin synthase
MREKILDKINNTSLKLLMQEAEKIRKDNSHNNIELCSIINARSGRCSENCKYCAQSTFYNTKSEVYPLLNINEIIQEAERVSVTKIKYFSIVTSGAKLRGNEFRNVCKTVKEIKKRFNLKVCASLGILSENEFSEIKAAGLDRYHHNLETSENFYPEICTTHDWKDRFNTVVNAKKAGLEVCSGGLFGLGESWKDRIELAETIKGLDVDSIPINFLFPIKGTPLENQSLLSEEDALKIIILFRLLIPKKTIRICGGRPTVLKEKQNMIFSAGANAMMTGNYLTTPGIDYESDLKMIKNNNLEINNSLL